MPGRTLLRTTIVAGLVLACVAGGLPAQPPPAVQIEAGGRLLPQQVRQMRQRISYWLDQLSAAQTEAEIRAAGRAIVSDYRASENVDYRYNYGEILSEEMPDTLKEIRGPVREINLALAVRGINQVTIQPALERLLASENPAVRYLAWGGYRDVRMLLLAQGESYARRMYGSVRQAATGETSPEVVGQIFRMLTLPPVTPAGVREQTLSAAREEFYGILRQMWSQRCREVLAGSAGMTGACRRGVVALNSFAVTYGDEPERREQILQMCADMAWCASRAYDAAKPDTPVVRAAEQLLRDIENMLNSLLATQHNYLLQALTDPDVLPPRGAAVRRAVVESWMDVLADEGVERPDFEPATRPS